jgi:hypothetical protein
MCLHDGLLQNVTAEQMVEGRYSRQAACDAQVVEGGGRRMSHWMKIRLHDGRRRLIVDEG